MIFPEIEELKALRGKFNRAVVYREISGDTVTPIGLARKFSGSKYLFLLESANMDKMFSRFSFLGWNPARTVLFRNGNLIVRSNGDEKILPTNPAAFLAEELRTARGCPGKIGDFAGGFVGFFGYETVNYMDVLREPVKEPQDDLLAGFFDVNEFCVFDNHLGKLYAACVIDLDNDLAEAYSAAEKRTAKIAEELMAHDIKNGPSDSEPVINKEYTESEFVDRVRKVKEDIIAGEAIQVVFSSRYEAKARINPLSFYRALRNINPSPYMFYLKFDETVICGSSPEIHLKVKDRQATLKPIAGTYPVSGDIEKATESLLADPKEQAEHLMLLDLARNDLYRGCDVETVKVTESFTPETYSHVIHIVSTVTGTLRNATSALDLFFKTFPAGTVSGAPKVRAMELISQYEKSPRGFYAGCVGYFGYDGNLDTCITIRSALFTDGKMVLRAGAGIVFDSDPAREFGEVERKLMALFTAVEMVRKLEEENVFAR